MTMDIMQALANIPLAGPYIPYLVLLMAVLGGVAHLVAPYMPPPTSQYGAYALCYGLINRLGGNYNYATNAAAPKPPMT